jgi:glycosyltransferase involved in cell wall biosynthesis
MHILMLCHEFPPLGGGGGRVCYEIARELVQSDCKVTVITTNHRNLPHQEHMDGIEIHRVYGKRKSDLHNNVPITMASFLTLGTQKARQYIQNTPIDLIHAYFTIPAGLSGVWLKKTTGLPLVVSPHGSDVPHHNPEKFNLPVRLLTPIIKKVWQKADRVVTVSDGLRQTALRTAPNMPIDVIHNGIDTHHFTPPHISPQNKIPQLIAVGRLVKLKGLHNLIEALAQVKQQGHSFHLKIVGDGPEKNNLIKQAEHLAIKESVTFLGHIPHENLPHQYQQADLFVLPSLAESFGQVFAEAMACGLPIIGSTTGGIPEVVGSHQQEWLIPPGDVSALAKKISKLLALSDQRQKLRETNPDYVRNHLTWSHCAQAYLELYQSLIVKV